MRRGVSLDGGRIEAATVIWAAGVIASPRGNWIGAEHDRAGRIKVNADLGVPGRPEIFAVGDTAAAFDRDGPPGSRHRAGRQADGPLRRQSHRRAGAGPAARRRSPTAISATSPPSAASPPW